VKPLLKWVFGAGTLLFVALQLTNPAHTNPPVLGGHDLLATHPPPPPIAALLKRSCYDCHSYETRWPWYSYVAPFSWPLAAHVNDARARLNFSDWPHGDPARARKKWNRVADAVEAGEMPLPQYVWFHHQARLDAAQRQQLIDWAGQEARRLAASP
jgi:hypothetical protein